MTNAPQTNNLYKEVLNILTNPTPIEYLKDDNGENMHFKESGEIALEEDAKKIMKLIKSDRKRLLYRMEEIIGAYHEQNITRDKNGNLICQTCGRDVFGGICECTSLNALLKSQRLALKRLRKEEL